MKKRLHPFWYELSPEQRRVILRGAYAHINRDRERNRMIPIHLHFDEEGEETMAERLFGPGFNDRIA